MNIYLYIHTYIHMYRYMHVYMCVYTLYVNHSAECHTTVVVYQHMLLKR